LLSIVIIIAVFSFPSVVFGLRPVANNGTRTTNSVLCKIKLRRELENICYVTVKIDDLRKYFAKRKSLTGTDSNTSSDGLAREVECC
jgi:hypothetical protein